MSTPSLQETYFPHMRCFGCGPDNPDGLRLRSYPGPTEDAPTTASFTPAPHHDNGLGFLNGGIIATLLDCHSASAVVHTAHLRDWGPEEGVPLPYVTAGLDVRYLRPTPLEQPVALTAEVLHASYDAVTAQVRLSVDDKVRAEALTEWKRWRAR